MNLAAHSLFRLQLQRRLEEVLVQPQSRIQRAQRSQFRRRVKPSISHFLAHVCPIALFYPGIVIFLIWPRPRHLDVSLPTVTPQKVVDQAMIVIPVDLAKAKRRAFADAIQCFTGGFLSSSRNRFSLPPSTGDVHRRYGM